MPSVNELVVSDAGTSGSARVAKAVAGVRTAVQLLRAAGVPARQIIVLPMPPIGARFVEEYTASVDVDQSLPSMIVAVNAGLTDILDVPGYPTLDGDNNGVAADRFFDDLFDPVTRRTADGLHLDIDGHEALAADIDDFFALR
jgi:lysophospholipase L1-like esterase